jgi:hypothetical protein
MDKKTVRDVLVSLNRGLTTCAAIGAEMPTWRCDNLASGYGKECRPYEERTWRRYIFGLRY